MCILWSKWGTGFYFLPKAGIQKIQKIYKNIKKEYIQKIFLVEISILSLHTRYFLHFGLTERVSDFYRHSPWTGFLSLIELFRLQWSMISTVKHWSVGDHIDKWFVNVCSEARGEKFTGWTDKEDVRSCVFNVIFLFWLNILTIKKKINDI